MTAPSQQLINERLRDKIKDCPCCGALRFNLISAKDDFIGEGKAFEMWFDCGSRISIDEGGEYSADQGCPQPLRQQLEDLHEEVISQLEIEFPIERATEDA